MTDGVRIEFPCPYPLRVIGDKDEEFPSTVLDIVRLHAPDLDEATVSVRDSRDGNYCSVRFTIVATGEPQLRALHEALMVDSRVRMVL